MIYTTSFHRCTSEENTLTNNWEHFKLYTNCLKHFLPFSKSWISEILPWDVIVNVCYQISSNTSANWRIFSWKRLFTMYVHSYTIADTTIMWLESTYVKIRDGRSIPTNELRLWKFVEKWRRSGTSHVLIWVKLTRKPLHKCRYLIVGHSVFVK